MNEAEKRAHWLELEGAQYDGEDILYDTAAGATLALAPEKPISWSTFQEFPERYRRKPEPVTVEISIYERIEKTQVLSNYDFRPADFDHPGSAWLFVETFTHTIGGTV